MEPEIQNLDIEKFYNGLELYEMWGDGKRFGFVKISTKQVYWYALINEKKSSGVGVTAKLSDLISIFNDFHPIVKDLLNNTEEKEVIFRNIVDFKTPKLWYNNNVCLIGDAVHAATPNLGQGACQAIEDVYILYHFLQKYDSVEAFKKYNNIRYARTSWLVERSRQFGQISQLENKWGIKIRNIFLQQIPYGISLKLTEKILDLNYYDKYL